MRMVIATIGIAICCSACSSLNSSGAAKTVPGTQRDGTSFTENERHRLYSAALAANESPLDSEIFKDVCRKIGIFDAKSQPNEQYMEFVAQHVNWSLKAENAQFRSEIDTKEKAREYINRHLP